MPKLKQNLGLASMLMLLAACSVRTDVAGRAVARAGSKARPRNVLSVPLEVQDADGVRVRDGEISIYQSIPAQEHGNPIVLEAECYESVNWQEANTKTMVSETWIDEVQSRGAQTCTFDAEASGQGCIERVSATSYPFYVNEGGTYTVWMRYWKPNGAFWCHEIQVNDVTSDRIVLDRSVEVQKWFWQKVAEMKVKPGNNMFFVKNLHGGKRLDKIVIARDPAFSPEGIGPVATAPVALKNGSIRFRQYVSAGAVEWLRVVVDRNNDCGSVKTEYSFDGGETWKPTDPSGGIISPGIAPQAIDLRMSFAADGEGRPPAIMFPEISYVAAPEAYPALENQFARYTFDSLSGALSGIEVKTGRGGVRIMPTGSARATFRLKVKPDRPVPGDWHEFAEFRLTGKKRGDDRIEFTYAHETMPIAVVIRYVLDPAGYLWCEADIENRHLDDVTEIEFARLSLVRVGASNVDDVLIWPVGTGKKYAKPVTAGTLSMTYPKACVGYFDLYDDDAGVYVASQDPDLISTVMFAAPDPSQTFMNFSMTKRHRVKSGGRDTFRVVVGAHPGDWHAAAHWYKDWFMKAFAPPEWPAWIQESDGWQFGNATYDLRHFDDLKRIMRNALRLGLSHVQMWGTGYAGGGGQYYYPPDYLGGEEAFIANNKWWQDRGGRVGYYMFPNGINAWVMWPEHRKYFNTPWEKIPAYGRPPGWDEGKSWEWAMVNAAYNWDRKKPEPNLAAWAEWEKKGGWQGNHCPMTGPVDMSPMSQEWLDWYKSWVADIYAGKYHAGTSYNDTMHYGGEAPQFNPYLKQNGEGDGGMWRHRWAREIRDRARHFNLDYLPIMEMQCDAYGMFISYMISASAIDTEMLYYTHPDHLAHEGQSGNGQWGEKRFKRFGSAWCYGTRLDHRHAEAWAVATIMLRHQITRWVNESRFIDDLGLAVTDPDVRGKLRRINHENGSRGFLATFWNTGRYDYAPDNFTIKNQESRPFRLSVDLKPMSEIDGIGTAPDDWIPEKAVLIDFNRTPQLIDFNVIRRDGRPFVECVVPSRWINGVLFVTKAEAEHAYLAWVRQDDFKRLDVHLLNLKDESLDVVVKVKAETFKFPTDQQSVTIKKGGQAVVSFDYPGGQAPAVTELVMVDVAADDATRTIRAAAYPFMDDPSFEGRISHRQQYSDLAAAGKTSAHFGIIETINEPGAKYRIRFKVRGVGKAGKGMARLGSRNDANRLDGVLLEYQHEFEVPKDQWGEVSYTFETPELFWHHDISLEAPRGFQALVDDVRLERLPADAEVDYRPAYVAK